MTVVEIRIAADHPAFAGHFPGMPIVPGVVLLDAALEAIVTALGITLAGCTLTAVKFTGLVGPGQKLALRFESQPGRVRFELESGGQVVMTGALSLAASGEAAA